MSDEPQWVDWSAPATKGDVVTIGIWTQGVFNAARWLADATRRGDGEAQKAALESFDQALKELSDKVDEIGGWRE